MGRRRCEDRDTNTHLAELAGSPTWMYEWDLGGGLRTTLIDPELMSVHETRAAIIEPLVREALVTPGARALDLGCSEGWFAHRLLDWGADRVVGVDIRQENIERAELVRDHLGIEAERLSFETTDVFGAAQLGSFDVVLCLGLVYHLENPVGALRVARGLTRRLCMIESQLTEQVAPIRHGWGRTGEYLEQDASWAAWFEPAELQEHHPIASSGGVVSFIPNRAALLQAISAAGFSSRQPLATRTGNAQYVEGHRLVVAARP